jgi:electron transfer flavoprotein beta subunit
MKEAALLLRILKLGGEKMEIIVCVKRVPETAEAEVKIAEGERSIEESGLVFDINEWDNYALEEALLLKERFGGSVTVVTMGPKESDETLRMCLAKGADSAVRLTDERFANSDGYATARILSQAIKGMDFDIVLTGAQTSDDGYAQVGVTLAELLGVPHASLVRKIEIEEGIARVNRELEGGLEEVLEVELPAVFTIQTGINEPRYASILGIRRAMKKEIKVLGLEELGLSEEEVGEDGSKTRLEKLFTPPVERMAEILRGTPEEVSAELTEILRREGI